MPKGQKKLNKEFSSEQYKAVKGEEKRQRDLVKNVLYPFLVRTSKNIEDAKNILYATDVALQGAFHLKVTEQQKRISGEKLSFLEIEKIIIPTPEFDRDRELIEMLKDETIATASTLLGGLKTVIEGFQREESTNRSLDTLKTDFL